MNESNKSPSKERNMNLEDIIKRDGFQKFLNKCKSYKKDNPNEHMIIWSDSEYYYRDISVRFTTKTDYPNEYGKVVFIYSLCAEDAKRSNRKSMLDLECYVKEKLESEGMGDNSLEQKNLRHFTNNGCVIIEEVE